MTIYSKLVSPMYTTCHEYVHPRTHSCYTASAMLLLHALQSSFRLYVTVYALALLMKGRKPSKRDIQRTICGILQSTAFIGCHAVGFSLCACFFRHFLGHFNFFTYAFLPTFVSSWFAILVERPSRRSLLSLYVTNIASETLYYMFVWRKIVKPIPFADVLLFMCSISYLLYLYRSQNKSADSIYSLIRFIVGPYEQIGYASDSTENESSSKEFVSCAKSKTTLNLRVMKSLSTSKCSSTLPYRAALVFFILVEQCKNYLKTVTKCQYCSHPHGCLYYWLQGSTKIFVIGYGLQLSLRILMQFKKIIQKPILLLRVLKSPNTFSLGAFLGGFSFLYKFISCTMRRWLQKDAQSIAFPAALIAGSTFCFYRSNTIALHVMWKALQILYLVGRDNNIVPEVPHASILFHCLSTAILFQAAIFEPQNLRSSYWNFLHNMSGGRLGEMDRKCLDVYGLESSKMVEMIKSRHKRH